MLPVIRRTGEGDELWLFVVLQEQQLEPALEARVIAMLSSTTGIEAPSCHVYQLSTLPVTRGGRLMRRQVEGFVNHVRVPNRLQMRNPEVLEEIAQVVRLSDDGDSRGETLQLPLTLALL